MMIKKISFLMVILIITCSLFFWTCKEMDTYLPVDSVGVSRAAICSPTTTITVPFSKNGSGEFCWETTSLCTYINSWNLDLLEVNGTAYTNLYAASSNIAKVNNKYVIHYKSSVAWGHFEIAGTCSGGSTAAPTATPTRTTTGATRTATRTTTRTQTQNSKSHVFLLLGQSNMAGYPTAQQADKVEDSRIMVLGFDSCGATGRQTDQWDVACPPLHECYLGAIGPGDWFAKTMIAKYPQGDTIRLVPCAISGERIETFLKSGGAKYSWIINRARLAQQAGGVIDGILFHQGESNNGDTSWPGKVNQLVKDLKADLGLGNIPFIAGELLYSGSCAGHNTLINQLPGVVSNCSVVSASGLVVDPADTQWKLHFGHDSQVTLGKRYAEKMIAALGL